MSETCPWHKNDPLYKAYHDEEWGVPLVDERRQFEFLLLEGFQAGLSWITVLRKRPHYREVFQGFDPEYLAGASDALMAEWLTDAGLIRNRQKMAAARKNAQAYLRLREEGRTLTGLMWSFVEGAPIVNHRRAMSELPAQTPRSVALSKELKRRGFSFVGPTIVYAHMQAAGMVNDHLVSCHRHAACEALGRELVLPPA